MGEVFAACDTTLGRRVAVKVIASELAGSGGRRDGLSASASWRRRSTIRT
jgi:hypothetical protein